MRTAKFDVPSGVLTDFLDEASDRGLNSTVVSHTDDEYNIEVDYEKEDSEAVDELEEVLETLIEDMETDDK